MHPLSFAFRKCLCLCAVAVAASAGCTKPIDFGHAGSGAPGVVTGVHHIVLTVSNLSRSVRFYSDALGMRVEYQSFHFAMLGAGSFGVALSDEPWDFEKRGEPKGVGMIPHFVTPNMDALGQRLKKHGVTWLRAPRNESYGIEAFITDPDGYQWAILAPLKPK